MVTEEVVLAVSLRYKYECFPVFWRFASLYAIQSDGYSSAMVFFKSAVLALALLPFSLAQISNDFESGWDQTAWPIYAPDCNQVGLFYIYMSFTVRKL